MEEEAHSINVGLDLFKCMSKYEKTSFQYNEIRNVVKQVMQVPESLEIINMTLRPKPRLEIVDSIEFKPRDKLEGRLPQTNYL